MEITIPDKYQKDINTAVEILKQEGCESIYLFGSLVTGNVHENSDIDIGIKGLNGEKFITVYGQIDDNTCNDIDLIDFDEYDKMFNLLTSIGEAIKIG